MSKEITNFSDRSKTSWIEIMKNIARTYLMTFRKCCMKIMRKCFYILMTQMKYRKNALCLLGFILCEMKDIAYCNIGSMCKTHFNKQYMAAGWNGKKSLRGLIADLWILLYSLGRFLWTTYCAPNCHELTPVGGLVIRFSKNCI